MHDLDITTAVPLRTLTASVATSIVGTDAVAISAITQSVWVKFGKVTLTATKGTAGEFLVPAGQVVYFSCAPYNFVAIIEEVAGGIASIGKLG